MANTKACDVCGAREPSERVGAHDLLALATARLEQSARTVARAINERR